MLDNQSAGLPSLDFMSNNMYPQSQQDMTQYATPSQLPAGAQDTAMQTGYEAKTNPVTGELMAHYAAGGIASIPRYNGNTTDGSDVQAWDPSSGQVTLQQMDPTGQSDPKNVAYTIPKDNIKTFVPNGTDENGNAIGGGKYILNDGSTMIVGGDGTVTGATPARNEYTLNQQGYYQPTGSGLNWNGSTSTLTKNIGGVDVQVPGQYTKGGYQTSGGSLATDANGVPVALAPAQYDSGAGKSGLSDAAPLMAIAAMAAMGMPEGAAALGEMGPTYAELGYSPDYFAGLSSTGSVAGTAGSQLTDAQIAALNANMGDAASGTVPSWATESADAMANEAAQTAQYNTAPADIASKAAGMTAAQKALLINQGLSALNSGLSSTNTPTSSGGIASAPAATTTPPVNQFGVTGYIGEAPTGQAALYSPTLSKLKNAPGEQYFAQGGIASLGSYSDGGQLLKGPGDGMSDNIPAKIGQHQPARLADGEFVIPADVVSHLGNGSTDAGAKQLYAMMDRIRKARTGNKKQGKQINPSKFLP